MQKNQNTKKLSKRVSSVEVHEPIIWLWYCHNICTTSKF